MAAAFGEGKIVHIFSWWQSVPINNQQLLVIIVSRNKKANALMGPLFAEL